MEFPRDWPGGCPPDDAEQAAGPVYRLARSSPLDEADFRTHHEMGTLLRAPACLRCGLSVFRTFEDAEHQQRLLPGLGNYIALGELASIHGVSKLTSGRQPTHTTWWPYQGVERAAIFRLVETTL